MPPNPNATEVTARRTHNAKHYQNPDGSYSAIISNGPIHYKAVQGGAWLDKKQRFAAGPGTNEWVSSESDITMRTYQVGQGGNATWWIQFTETLTGQGVEFQVLGQPTTTAGSNTLSFSDGAGRPWTYTHTRTGGKMWGPQMTNTEPATTYTFNYRLLGGAPALTVNTAGDLVCGTIFTMPRSYMLGANNVRYPAGAWTIGGGDPGTVSFTMDHAGAGLPAAAYPFRLDPSSTFNVAASANDAFSESGGTSAYPPNGVSLTYYGSLERCSAYRGTFAPDYWVDTAYFRWDTSSLSGYTVTAATFRMVNNRAIINDDSKSVLGDYFAWTWTSTDHVEGDVSGAVNYPLSSASTAIGAQNDVPLLNVDTGINTSGNTSLRLVISSGIPSGQSLFEPASWDHATLQEPQLLVDYSSSENDYIQVGPDGTGKKKRGQTFASLGPDATHTVEVGYDAILDESTGNRARVLNAVPASTDYGLVTSRIDLDKRPANRTMRTFTVANLQGNVTSATLVSLDQTNDYAAGTTANNFTVTSGKTFSPEYIIVANRQLVTTGGHFWVRVDLRVNTGGTVTASSPIMASLLVPADVTAIAAFAGGTTVLPLGWGIEIPAGASFGLTRTDSGGTATRVNFDIALYGYEYS